MIRLSRIPASFFSFFYPAALLLGLYLMSLSSYALFHALVELFGVIVACGIFMIAWNARRFFDNDYFLYIGIAFLFVAVLDLFHILAFAGLDMFGRSGPNLASQLWLAARFLQGLSLVIAPLLIGRSLRPHKVFAAYAAVTAAMLGSIVSGGLFPAAVAEGSGMTRFGMMSEGVIILLLLASVPLLSRKRDAFDRRVFILLVVALSLGAAAELAFVSSHGASDRPNVIGHLFKVLSFYLIYKGIIQTGLVQPYDLLFRNTKKSEESLREERDRVQNYLDVARSMLVVIDADQRVSLINKKGCEILGCREREIVGKNWFDTFIPERIRGSVKDAFEKLIAGEIQPVEYFENPVVDRSGGERMIAWHNAVLEDVQGTIIATVSSGEDITERKKAEERLAQKTAELERSNAELERFSAIVSHDLKEPLLSIGGFAAMLRDRYRDGLDERARGFLNHIFDGVTRMERLINDLLGYARVTTRGKPFQAVHGNDILKTVLVNLRQSTEASGAVITADELPVVMGDETQCVQLFQNLIGNAVKYRGGRPPRIHVSARKIAEAAAPAPEVAGRGWVFSVTDNGIGIDRGHFDLIFEMFGRVPGSSQSPGTGLGLAMCKKIVERHGGRIWVESEPGRGSTFYFTIPERT